MSISWVFILTLVISFLQLYSGYITATKQTKIEETNTLTKWGRRILFIMLFSGFFGIIIQVIDSINKNKEQKRNESISRSILYNTNRSVNPFFPVNLTFQINTPIDTSHFPINELFKKWKGSKLPVFFADTEDSMILERSYSAIGNSFSLYLDIPDSLSFVNDTSNNFTPLRVSYLNYLVSFNTPVLRIFQINLNNNQIEIITTFNNVQDKSQNNPKRIRGLIDLIDKYVVIVPSNMDEKFRLTSVNIETGKNFNLFGNLDLGHNLFIKKDKTGVQQKYFHKFSASELGFEEDENPFSN